MTDPSKLHNTKQQRMQVKPPVSPATHFEATKAEVNAGDGQTDELSEGEIDSSVTISALLSKLDSVRVRQWRHSSFAAIYPDFSCSSTNTAVCIPKCIYM